MLKRNALVTSASLSWGGVALIAVLLLLALRILAPNVFWLALAPAFGASDTLADASHAFVSSFADTAALALLNEDLLRRNDALVRENEALKEQLGSVVGLAEQPRGIIAGVVARPPMSPYDTLVLAAGSNAGVTLGMNAFGEDNVPLGVVTSVLTDFSRITLFSAPGVTFYGSVGAARLPLTIRGAGAGALHASAPRSAGIRVGDTVFAPGPGNLPIGAVARIDSDPSVSSVTLRIVPAVNPFSVTWVELRENGSTLYAPFSTTTPLLP